MRMFLQCSLPALMVLVALTDSGTADEIGLAVGKKVSGFSLNDQSGESRTLDELKKSGPVAIVFHRSANW